ncbi:MAG: hypothetical protein K8R40_13390 [Anaerolineaceae bacterium]|nr:hypothetical protein [Anaerolineaceae bacterium]
MQKKDDEYYEGVPLDQGPPDDESGYQQAPTSKCSYLIGLTGGVFLFLSVLSMSVEESIFFYPYHNFLSTLFMGLSGMSFILSSIFNFPKRAYYTAKTRAFLKEGRRANILPGIGQIIVGLVILLFAVMNWYS